MTDAPSAATGNQACTAGEALTAAPSGLPRLRLCVDRAGGAHALAAELAQSPEDQAQGLMFRTALGADEGMFFPMDPPRDAAFWMKNTLIPLDIIYIRADGRVANIAANTEPYSLTPLPSTGPVAAVLELRGGRAAELGIAPGTVIRWR